MQTRGRLSEAIDLTNKAIERDLVRPAFYNNLGRALLAVNRAEAAIRKALELDPDGASCERTYHFVPTPELGRRLPQNKSASPPPANSPASSGTSHGR